MRNIGFILTAVPLLVHSALAERLPVKVFTTADGLAHNHVNRIKVDSHGFLWFCTDAGLSRFDGRRFFTLTTADGLPHPDVNDLVEAPDGAFWLAGDGGISRFTLRSPANNEKPTIETFHSPEHPGEHFDALEFDRAGQLWAGGNKGLYRVESAAGSVNIRSAGWVIKDASIPRLLADRRGGLWIATTKGAAYRDPTGKLIPVQPSPLSTNPFAQALLQDRQGDVWVGYRSGGFCRLSRDLRATTIPPLYCIATDDGRPLADVRSISESSDGRFWIGATSRFCELAKENRKLTCYGKDHGLSEDWVHRVAEDPQGNLWLATLDSGVMRLTRPGFVQFTPEHPQRTELYLMNTTKGWMVFPGPQDVTLRMLSLDGHLLRQIWTTKLLRIPMDYAPPRSQGAFEDSQGHWWIPAAHHLYRYPTPTSTGLPDPSRFETFQLPPDHWHSRLLEDSSGMLWASVAIPGNAARRNSRWLVVRKQSGGPFQLVPSVEAAMARLENAIGMGAYISALREDRAGALWIGISSNSLVYTATTVTLLRQHRGHIREFSTADGLPPGNINSIYRDRKGRLWFATHAGLARLDDPLAEHPRFARYTLADGLGSAEVWCVVEDQQGRIYAGTSHGVDRLDPATGRVRHFSIEDGLPPGRVWAATTDHHGKLWFLSESAVSAFEPEALPAKPPTTFALSSATDTTLPYNRNFFEAQFTSPNFNGPMPRFQFRLLGAGQDWGPPVNESIVRYAGMSPGSYELQARAVNAEGIVSPHPVSLRFTVTPPFYRTWWFILLTAATISLAAYSFHRFRVEQLLALERLRLRIASDLHDDIASSLSQVSMLGEVAKRSLDGANPGVVDLIERMSSSSRDAVSAMRDIVWSIHPGNSHIDGITQRMRRFAADTLSAKGIDFEFDVPASQPDPPIGPHTRHDLLLIFKESIHNAVRHSGATSVHASLHFGPPRIQLIVQDDGRGFDPATSAPGHGLTSIQTRATKLGGRCEISSTLGKGTRIAVSIPINQRLS